MFLSRVTVSLDYVKVHVIKQDFLKNKIVFI